MSDDPIRIFVHGRAVIWQPPKRRPPCLRWCTGWAFAALLLVAAAITAAEWLGSKV